ncbi:MAG TPA: hypothetical protein VN947_07110 [Polyangia bacterium]|nr:hypothetical protein [Polyangia bacterium]
MDSSVATDEDGDGLRKEDRSRGDVALRWEPRERRIDRRASGALGVESDVDRPAPSTCGLPLQSQLRDWEQTAKGRDAMATYVEELTPASTIQLRSRISARAVLSGFILGAALALLTIVLGAAIFLSGFSPNAGAAKGLMIGFYIWSLVFFFVSAFFGAWVAASTCQSLARRDGIIHGLLVWALLSLGTAALVGGIAQGTVGTALRFGRTAAVAASQSPAVNQQLQKPGVQQDIGQAVQQATSGAKPSEIANTAASVGGLSMWAFFLVLALSFITSVLGGLAGISAEQRTVRKARAPTLERPRPATPLPTPPVPVT